MTATITALRATSLLTPADRARLVANGMASLQTETFDPFPVVRLTCRSLGTVWLLTEMDPNGTGDIAFGLCDQGEGCADLACVDLSAIAHADDRARFYRDPAFRATTRLSEYLARARRPSLRAAC